MGPNISSQHGVKSYWFRPCNLKMPSWKYSEFQTTDDRGGVRTPATDRRAIRGTGSRRTAAGSRTRDLGARGRVRPPGRTGAGDAGQGGQAPARPAHVRPGGGPRRSSGSTPSTSARTDPRWSTTCSGRWARRWSFTTPATDAPAAPWTRRLTAALTATPRLEGGTLAGDRPGQSSASGKRVF